MEDLFLSSRTLKEGEVVVDCRTAEEFNEGHVPGALNIDHEDLVDRAQELKNFKKVYVYCRSGGRATWAVDELERQGLTHLVCIVGSGMPNWISAGHPVE